MGTSGFGVAGLGVPRGAAFFAAGEGVMKITLGCGVGTAIGFMLGASEARGLVDAIGAGLPEGRALGFGFRGVLNFASGGAEATGTGVIFGIDVDTATAFFPPPCIRDKIPPSKKPTNTTAMISGNNGMPPPPPLPPESPSLRRRRGVASFTIPRSGGQRRPARSAMRRYSFDSAQRTEWLFPCESGRMARRAASGIAIRVLPDGRRLLEVTQKEAT